MTLNRIVALLLAVPLAATLGACSTGNQASSSQQSAPVVHLESATKVYTNVDALGKDSDLIVRGTVTRLAGTDVDNGGLGPGHGDVPVAFYTISVESHSGLGKVPPSITLGYLDTARVQSAELEPLVIGQEYVFFLWERTPRTAPGVAKKWTPFYVPTSGSLGVFTVRADGTAVAHMPELRALHSGGTAAERVMDRLAVPATDLLAAK